MIFVLFTGAKSAFANPPNGNNSSSLTPQQVFSAIEFQQQDVEGDAFEKIIPFWVWDSPEFHRILRTERWHLRAVMKSDAFASALGRNPELMRVWADNLQWPLTKKNIAFMYSRYGFFRILSKLSHSDRAPYRPLVSKIFLQEWDELLSTNFESSHLNHAMSELRGFVETELSEFLRQHPAALDRLADHFESMSDEAFFTDRAKFFIDLTFVREVRERLAPVFIRKINRAYAGEQKLPDGVRRPLFLRRPHFHFDRGFFPYRIWLHLTQHLNEIEDPDARRALLAIAVTNDKVLSRRFTFPTLTQRELILNTEAEVLAQCVVLKHASLEQRRRAQADLIEQLEKLQKQSVFDSFSASTLDKILDALDRIMPNHQINFAESQTISKVRNRILLLRPGHGNFPTPRATPLDVHVFSASNPIDFNLPAKLSDRLEQIAAGEPMPLHLPFRYYDETADLAPGSTAEGKAVVQRWRERMDAAMNRLEAQGLSFDPLVAPLRALAQLNERSVLPLGEGPLSPAQRNVRIGEERQRLFQTGDIDTSDSGIAHVDARLQAKVELEERIRPNATKLNGRSRSTKERQRDQLQQKRNLDSWRDQTRLQLARNLHSVIRRAQNEIQNLGINDFELPFQEWSLNELASWFQTASTAMPNADARIRALFFSPLKRALSLKQVEEAIFVLSSLNATLETTRNAFDFISTTEISGIEPRGISNILDVLREKHGDLLANAFHYEPKDHNRDLPWLLDNLYLHDHDVNRFRRNVDPSREVRIRELNRFRTARNFTRAKWTSGALVFTGALFAAGNLLDTLDFRTQDIAIHQQLRNRAEKFLHDTLFSVRNFAERVGLVGDDANARRRMRDSELSAPSNLFRNFRGGDRNHGADSSGPRAFRAIQNPSHNVPDQGTGPVPPSFDVVTSPGIARPQVFHVGEHHDFADPNQIEVIHMQESSSETAGEPAAPVVYVRTRADSPTILSAQGVGLMVAPDHSRLESLRIIGISEAGGRIELAASEYEVLRTKRWNDYAVRVLRPDVAAVAYGVGYHLVEDHVSAGENIQLHSDRLMPISYRLDQAGFHRLSQNLNAALARSTNGISVAELAGLVSGTSSYSYRDDTGVIPRTTRIESETNRYHRYARFQNESGDLAATCGTAANFTNEIINDYYENAAAEVRLSIIDSNNDGHLELSGRELHARSGVTAPDGDQAIVDGTSGTMEAPLHVRNVLPGGTPVSRNARYTDIRNLILYAFIGGQQTRREYFEWGKRQQRMLEDDAILDEELSARQRATVLAQMKLEAEREAADAKETAEIDSPNSTEEGALKNRLATDAPHETSSLFRPDHELLQEIRNNSEPAYELFSNTRSARSDLIRRQSELRTQKILTAQQASVLVSRALHYDRTLRRYLNGDASAAEVSTAFGVEFGASVGRPTLDEWRDVLSKIQNFSRDGLSSLQNLEDNIFPQLNNPDPAVRKRLKISPRNAPLVAAFRDAQYRTLTMNMLIALERIAGQITHESLDAIVQRRMRLPIEHTSRWESSKVLHLNTPRSDCVVKELQKMVQ